jgi:demethylmenaquinone methyltransferase / 2-methoxy-6-polyprenyl-1,4-benzoquinol methylase
MSSDASSEVVEAGAPEDRSARKRHALELFRGLPRRYDLLAAALSFGQDPRWRRALVRGVRPAPGERVLDVATGTGLVAAELLDRCGCTVVGIDQSAEMLDAARARFAERAPSDRRDRASGTPPVELIQAEAEKLPFADRSFDALTFTYLLRYVDDPRATMRELARVLRPGGRIASLEFGIPPWGPARAAWRAYTAVGLPILARLISSQWGEVGRFLGPSITAFYERHPVERIADYWREAGLQEVRVRRMSLGGGILMFATRAGERSPAGGPANAGQAHAGDA